MYTCFADPESGFDDEENDHGDFNRNESEGVLVLVLVLVHSIIPFHGDNEALSRERKHSSHAKILM